MAVQWMEIWENSSYKLIKKNKMTRNNSNQTCLNDFIALLRGGEILIELILRWKFHEKLNQGGDWTYHEISI